MEKNHFVSELIIIQISSVLLRVQGGFFCLRSCHSWSRAYDYSSLFQGEHFQLRLWSHSEEYKSYFPAGEYLQKNLKPVLNNKFFSTSASLEMGRMFSGYILRDEV